MALVNRSLSALITVGRRSSQQSGGVCSGDDDPHPARSGSFPSRTSRAGVGLGSYCGVPCGPACESLPNRMGHHRRGNLPLRHRSIVRGAPRGYRGIASGVLRGLHPSCDAGLPRQNTGCNPLRSCACRVHVFCSTCTGPDFMSRGAPGGCLSRGGHSYRRVWRGLFCGPPCSTVNGWEIDSSALRARGHRIHPGYGADRISNVKA